VNLGRAPRRPCGREGGAGRQSWARGRVLVFRKIIYYVFSAKSTHEKNAYPTPTLEEAAEGEGQEARHTHTHRPARRTRAKEETRKKREKDKTEKNRKKQKRRAKGETPTLEPGRRGQRPDQLFFKSRPFIPLRRPSRGRSETLGKSRRRTAYPQQIVTTRLLYCLQDRFAQLSRLQRI
jgi:hypothetical protein